MRKIEYRLGFKIIEISIIFILLLIWKLLKNNIDSILWTCIGISFIAFYGFYVLKLKQKILEWKLNQILKNKKDE